MKIGKVIFLGMVLGLVSVGFYACKDDAGTPSPGTPAVTLTEKEQAVKDYNEMYAASALTTADLAWTGDKFNCVEGTVSPETLEKCLLRINYFRKMCGLPHDMVWNDAWHNPAQKIAMMCDANNSLSHTPPTSWKCYSAEGAAAGEKTNLALGSFGSTSIMRWMFDDGANNIRVGHRRWILFSRAKDFGFGSTSKAAALYCIAHTDEQVPANVPEVIAYPSKYVPQELAFPRWSLGVVNPKSFYSGVSFVNTTVTVTDEDGTELPVNIISSDTKGYGDQSIVWEPLGINTTSSKDMVYHVKVTNVNLNGVDKDYEYDVTIFKP
jgi:uncharacterized protein YkwD